MSTWEVWTIGVVVVVAGVLLLPYVAQRTMDGAGGAGGGGGGAFGVLQEIFHPAAHESSIVVQEQKEREAPAPKGEDEEPEHV